MPPHNPSPETLEKERGDFQFQVRYLDPNVKREMRVEAARRGERGFGPLIREMWNAYVTLRYGDQAS